MSYPINLPTLIFVGCVELDVVLDAVLFAEGTIHIQSNRSHKTE
jgi:hypothetical protein